MMSRRLSPADVRAGTSFASRGGDPRFVRAEQAPLRHAGEATNPLTHPALCSSLPSPACHSSTHPSASRANVFPRRINHGSRVHRVRDPPPPPPGCVDSEDHSSASRGLGVPRHPTSLATRRPPSPRVVTARVQVQTAKRLSPSAGERRGLKKIRHT